MTEVTRPQADVWKSAEMVQTFLQGVRGGIPYAADQIDVMVRVVTAAMNPVRRFLDLGSGAGTVAAAVLAAHPEAEAVLVDFSEPMLEAARASFPSPPHTLVHADFNEPGWIDAVRDLGPFDAIVSGYAIHHSTDDVKRRVYAEIFELLGPGGAFVNIEHVKSATPWVGAINDALFVDTIHAHHQRIGSGKTKEQVAEEYVFRPDKAANILAPVEDQCAWLRDIGYDDVDCYFKVFELAVFGGRKPAAS